MPISQYDQHSDQYKPITNAKKNLNNQTPGPAPNTQQDGLGIQPTPGGQTPLPRVGPPGAGLDAGTNQQWNQNADNTWGDMYRNQIGKYGGGGGAGPKPEGINAPTLNIPDAKFMKMQGIDPVTAAQISWQWQNQAQGGGGGSGGGGGGGSGGWDVERLNLGQYAMDPLQQQQMQNLKAAQMNPAMRKFTKNMMNRTNQFMNEPTGMSDEEYNLLLGRNVDQIQGGAEAENAQMEAMLAKQGMLGGGPGMAHLMQAQAGRADRVAGARTDLDISRMQQQREGKAQALGMGMGMQGQLGQQQAQQQQMQNQIASLNQQYQYEISRGNVDRAQQIATQTQQLQAQSDMANAQSQNQAMMLRNELKNQRGIAAMQTGAQRDIAMNQMYAQVAGQNAQFQQDANMANQQMGWNVGSQNANMQNQMNMFNTGQQWQGGIAQGGWQQDANMFNANMMNQYNQRKSAAGNAGKNWDRQMTLSGIGSDIDQWKYNDALARRDLTMGYGMGQDVYNQGYGYQQAGYDSQPWGYQDPYAGLGAQGNYGGYY